MVSAPGLVLEMALQGNTSTSNATATAPIPTTNNVSWQSAYWGLVAVAANTLVQNSGTVCGLPSEYRIAARSSPIVCLVDATFIIIEFFWLLLLGCWPRTTARHIWYDRFQDPGDREESGITPSWRFNMLCFMLGALPQSIKIFGMQGIPGTQACTAVFLAAFLIPEFLRIFAGPARASGELRSMPIVSHAKQDVAYLKDGAVFIMGIVQYGIWAWILSNAIPYWLINNPWEISSDQEIFGPIGVPILLYLCCIGLVVLFLVALYLAVNEWFFLRVEKLSADSAGHIRTVRLVIFFIPFVFAIISILSRNNKIFAAEEYRLCSAAAGISVAYLLSIVLFRILFMSSFSRLPRRLFGLKGNSREFTSIFFFLMNFATATVYYSSVYDTRGTYKPTWTEKLG